MKICEVIRLIEEDGWFQVRMRGSHHQFKHPLKPGIVTVAGHLELMREEGLPFPEPRSTAELLEVA